MKKVESIAANHPVLFASSATIIWFVLELVLAAVAVGALRRPYADAVTATLSRLVTTAIVLWFIWRMGWLDGSGVAQAGRWQVWLVALAGFIYFACASLYSFFGEIAFGFSNLISSPAFLPAVLTHFAAGLSEEIMFRGLVLYSLARAWGDTHKGMLASVLLASLLFSVLHWMHIFTFGASISSALFLFVETGIVSTWWGALVLSGKSVWPAVMLHFMINALVSVQGLITPLIEPEILVYQRLLWFSLPLGMLGLGMLARTHPQKLVPEVA